jgi:hypothetical protein
MKLNDFIHMNREDLLEGPLFVPAICTFFNARDDARTAIGRIGWRSAVLVASLTVIPAYLLVETTVRLALLILSSPLLVTTSHRANSRKIGTSVLIISLTTVIIAICGFIQLGTPKYPLKH